MKLTRLIAASGGIAGGLLAAGSVLALPAPGAKAPDFTLPTVNAGTVHLQALEGRKPILLNFFTTQ
jgi:hypothetical protein